MHGETVKFIELCFVGWKVSTTGAKPSKKGIGPGRLATASTSPAVQRVSCIILDNRHVILDELQLATCLCHATIHAIILENLKTKEVRANWVTRDSCLSKRREGYSIVLHNKDQRGSLLNWLLVLSCGFTIKHWS